MNSELKYEGCETCGSKDCSRHNPDVAPEPWSGLLIHKQLDQAIEDFYNAILDQFINTWYSKITLQPFFIDELRLQLRYASASLLKRALKIDYGRLITERLVPCALRHYAVVSSGAKPALHVAACNRAAEMKYLRSLTEVLLPLVLQPNETNSSVFRVLVREVFAGWVLLSLTDVLADPYILNALIILATSDEKMSELPTTPNYKVEFLETFTRQTECVYSARCKLLQLDVETVLSQQEQLYAFMQHLKSTGHLQLLQFYKDIKLFQTTLLNPELSSVEREALAGSARALAAQCARLRLPQHMLRDLRHDLDSADVHKLQTSRALYQAARQSHAALEKVLLPRYLHSEEFYKLLIGSRVPTGYQKQMAKRLQDKLFNAAMKLGSRLKGALRSQAIDGQVLDCCNSELEDEGMENLDILKYLDSIAAEDSMEQDLANFKVVLTNVETQLQAPPRRGTVRVFTLAVHRAGGAVGAAGAGGAVGAGGAALWGARRTEHDFHLLRAKLQEFHGDALHDLALPSRRDNSPLETLRYKYEDFLQRLLQKPLLQTSELLYLFLTVDGDFSLVVQASTLNANSTDLGNIYHSVAHKLRKEKGQHLESFLRNFLVSSDKERYQALKLGVRDVEEALEADEGSSLRAWANSAGGAAGGGRGARGQVFGDNFAEPPPAPAPRHSTHQTAVVGFTHCFMYLLVKVVKAPMFLCGIVGSLLAMARTILDDAFNSYLNRTLSTLLCERRLAHLIQLGHGLLFGKKSLSPRTEVEKQRESARAQLLRRVPAPLSGLHAALNNAFDIIQSPHLNKQLVYSLLDLCVLELFPELQDKGVTNS
ncbi:Sorting nexin-14 [Papilio xuthus]|uniref:Sorting nexin-14 n=1 Tax=Papilio xuthus TaxID=66420 RepID=A0A194Q9F6_PAPXU|nr:Sorting nexin-14 [Papilio xuthus]